MRKGKKIQPEREGKRWETIMRWKELLARRIFVNEKEKEKLNHILRQHKSNPNAVALTSLHFPLSSTHENSGGGAVRSDCIGRQARMIERGQQVQSNCDRADETKCVIPPLQSTKKFINQFIKVRILAARRSARAPTERSALHLGEEHAMA